MSDPSNRPIARALVSVYDKTGLVPFARALAARGVEILSTGGSARALAEAGLAVTDVAAATGFPEMLDGRVKTLHPRVHAGILADRRMADHRLQLIAAGIAPFELVVVNLYPFAAAAERPGITFDELVEEIDIGGPSMVRAAAKNHGSVAVVTAPSRYADVLAALPAGGFTLDQRRQLAAEAFARTAAYDIAVASWFASAYAPDETAREAGWPAVAGALWQRADVLRYGENPHQRAALYVRPGHRDGIAAAELLHGKAMSYNNYVDADAARRAAYDFAGPCVAIIKHSNPCGIAIGADLADAHAKAHACDPVSAFGGVIAANGPVTAALARQVKDVFTEVVIAPGFDAEALDILSASKNVRLLRWPGGTTPPDPPALPSGGTHPPGPPLGGAPRPPVPPWELRQVTGGMLLQSADRVDQPGDDPANWQLKAGQPVSPEMLADLAFAWKACRSVKSNAILLASGGASVGVGMGQVNRVDSARLAVARAGDRAVGSVAASDAYFPFPDGFEILAQAGVAAVVEPGGSVRDHLVIAAAGAAGIPLYFTGVRHFYH